MRALVTLLVAVAASAVPAAGASAEVRAEGRLGGSDTALELRVANTSDAGEAIACLYFQAPTGVRITGASGPGTVSAGGNLFESRNLRLAAGGTAVFRFTTAADYPDDQGGTLLVSSTCEAGTDRAFGVDPARADARIASVVALSRHPTLSPGVLGLGGSCPASTTGPRPPSTRA